MTNAPQCGRGVQCYCSTSESFHTSSRNIAEGCLTSLNTEQDVAVRQNEEGTENWLLSFVYCESTPVLSVL